MRIHPVVLVAPIVLALLGCTAQSEDPELPATPAPTTLEELQEDLDAESESHHRRPP